MFGRIALVASLLLFIQVPAGAASTEQLAAIKRLGKLNGIALQCKALPQTQRMKRALVMSLPKRRQLGELFDNETNASFMQFIKENATCPSPQELHLKVDAAISELKKVYPVQ